MRTLSVDSPFINGDHSNDLITNAEPSDEKEMMDSDSMKLKANFKKFSIFFGIVYGGVQAVLTILSAKLEDAVGFYGWVTFYSSFLFTLLFVSKVLMKLLDGKLNISIGIFGLLLSLIGFTLSYSIDSMQWGFYIFGALMGGLGSGIVWPSQSAYFTSNALEYAGQLRSDPEKHILSFSGTFSYYYLLIEAVFKLVAVSAYILDDSLDASLQPAILSIAIAAACISGLSILFSTLDLDSQGTYETHRSHAFMMSSPFASAGSGKLMNVVVAQAQALGKTVANNYKVQLLIPLQLTFGLSAGLVTVYVHSVIVERFSGIAYVGLVSGIVTLSAAWFSIPFTDYASQTAQGRMMLLNIAMGCCGVAGLCLAAIPDSEIADWGVLLLYYLVLGIARAIWESVNKAMIATMFPNDEIRASAFCALYFFTGLAMLFSYLADEAMGKYVIGALTIAFSIVAVVCYHYLEQYHIKDCQSALLSSVRDLTNL